MIYRLLKKISVYHPAKFFYSTVRMSGSILESIKEVDIDADGVFKYILIKVYAGEKKDSPAKVILRGYQRCPYHSDIYDEVTAKELAPNKLDGECLGGGRIQHQPKEKKINIYGYSQGFGKADHSVSAGLLEKVFPDYSVTWTDDGY